MTDPDATQTLHEPVKELETGSLFAGRYRVIEELGRGGMGRVYKVHDMELGVKIALKLIRAEISGDPETVERFRNELKTAREITHKNICRMYDLGKEGGTYFITMEYVPGEDLKSMICMSGQLGAGTALAITRQICEGLAEAHRHGVVHRDLKSANVMIDREGTAKIMDFGLARSARATGLTGAGVVIGTPEYMSPEQVEAKETDPRSDIYSLGVILYEMLTGHVPFEADTPLAVAVKHKSEPPPDPRIANPQIPDGLGRLVLRCLEKDTSRRFQSVDELLAALDTIQQDSPTAQRAAPWRAKPLSTREITVTLNLPTLWKPALAVAGAAALVLLGAHLLTRRPTLPTPTDRRPSVAVMYFKNNTGDKGLDHWRRMLSDLLIADLAQSRLLRVLSEDRLTDLLERLGERDSDTYSSSVLRNVSEMGRVGHILQGSYAKAGEEFRINAVLLDARTGDHVAIESVAGKGEESVFPMVDELTRRIKKSLNLSAPAIASDIDKEVGQITTSSPQALACYTEGRRYHNAGDYRRSIQLMRKALEHDPDFAMACRSMGVSYGNLGLFNERRSWLEKARGLAGRLSEAERLTIEGDYFRETETTWDKAIQAFRSVLAIYPDHSLANHQLGLIYADLEDWDESIERYEACVRARSEFIPSYTQLAQAYYAKGLHDKALQTLWGYIGDVSDSAEIRAEIASSLIHKGDLAAAAAEVERALAIDPNEIGAIAARGDVAVCLDDPAGAEAAYRKLIDMGEPWAFAFGVSGLGNLFRLQGRFREAEAVWKKALAYAEAAGQPRWILIAARGSVRACVRSGNFQKALTDSRLLMERAKETGSTSGARSALFFQACALIAQGDLAGAERAIDGLGKVIAGGMSTRASRFHDHALGLLALAKGDAKSAIGHLERALALAPNGPLAKDGALLRDLGAAYEKAGRIAKAIEVYAQVAALTAGRLDEGDAYARSFYDLGRLWQARGDRAKAADNLRRFLELWKDADAGRPEVADAKTRLAVLDRVR